MEPKITRPEAKKNLNRLDKIEDFILENFESLESDSEEDSVFIDENISDKIGDIREVLRKFL